MRLSLLFGAPLTVVSSCLLAVHKLDIAVLTAQCKFNYKTVPTMCT